jgi:hypothetical protein
MTRFVFIRKFWPKRFHKIDPRAANLSHCRIGDRAGGQFWLNRESCVKHRAANSVRVIKGLAPDAAMSVVERNYQVPILPKDTNIGSQIYL